MEENNTILIIDDEISIRNMLKVFVESHGYEAITKPSAKEGLATLRIKNIKLVLLDICMPEESGLELLKKIKSITPSTNVIMITGQENMEVAKECMKLGAKDYIRKPFDMDYLETSIFAEYFS
ncbi:MAG: response regulator [Verrucomicrobiota bacterium]|nr:response regulator [Verrucomicrobiota bacterium]